MQGDQGRSVAGSLGPRPDQEGERTWRWDFFPPNSLHAAAFEMAQSDPELAVRAGAPGGAGPVRPPVEVPGTLLGAGKGVSATRCRSSVDVAGSLGIKLTRVPRHDNCSVRFSGRAECVHEVTELCYRLTSLSLRPGDTHLLTGRIGASRCRLTGGPCSKDSWRVPLPAFFHS